MSNSNKKTILTRRAKQWDDFLNELIKKIREVGYDKNLYKVELERLILKHKFIKEIEKDVVNGFKGVEELNKEVESWLKG